MWECVLYLEGTGTSLAGFRDNDEVKLVFEKSPLAAGVGKGPQDGNGRAGRQGDQGGS